MRITRDAMVHDSLRRLSGRPGASERARTRLAAGTRPLEPADDPAGGNRDDTPPVIHGPLAEVEDPTCADIMELETQEMAYRATLQVLSEGLPPSLRRFIR